jgi:hypothetical protein
MIRRAVAIWGVIILAEVVHGIARTLFLQPIVGDFRARQIAVFTGSAHWSDYNLLQGGLLPIGLLVLTVAPLLAARWRGVWATNPRPHP